MVEEKTTLAAPVAANVPAFLQGDKAGTEDLTAYIIPPRFKVLQPLSAHELVEAHGAGSVIINPQSQRLIDKDGVFRFTPLFFFPEWISWNPIAAKGTLNAIRERTFNGKSELARKSKNELTRIEPCPEFADEVITHCEHLNFIVLTYDTVLGMTPCVMSFSRAEHKVGTSFAGLLKMRQVAIYGGVYEARISLRTNAQGHWYGFDLTNPSEGDSFIAEETFAMFQELHAELKAGHDKSLIHVDHDGEEARGADPAATDAVPF